MSRVGLSRVCLSRVDYGTKKTLYLLYGRFYRTHLWRFESYLQSCLVTIFEGMSTNTCTMFHGKNLETNLIHNFPYITAA